MKTDEEIGVEAARLAHNKILQEAKSVRLTTKKVLRRISQGLDAHEIKCKFDGGQHGSQKWVYSKKLVNWDTRSKSIDQAMAVLDMKPKEIQSDSVVPEDMARKMREAAREMRKATNAVTAPVDTI